MRSCYDFQTTKKPNHSTDFSCKSCLKSQLKSTCMTTKFGSLDHAETGEKGQNVISSSVQHLISLIFAIHVSFIIPLPMMWILLTKPIYAEICGHSQIATQRVAAYFICFYSWLCVTYTVHAQFSFSCISNQPFHVRVNLQLKNWSERNWFQSVIFHKSNI